MVIDGSNVKLSSPFGPLTVTAVPSIVTLTPSGTGMGAYPILDIMEFSIYQTYKRSSPPMPWRQASRPVMIPFEVEMNAMPRPPKYRGISLWLM